MSAIAIPNGGPSGIASMSPRAKPTDYAVKGPFQWGLSHQAFDRVADLIKNWGILGFVVVVFTLTASGIVVAYSKTAVEIWRATSDAAVKEREAKADVDKAVAATLTKFMATFDQHTNAMHEIQRQQSTIQTLLNRLADERRNPQ